MTAKMMCTPRTGVARSPFHAQYPPAEGKLDLGEPEPIISLFTSVERRMWPMTVPRTKTGCTKSHRAKDIHVFSTDSTAGRS